MRESTKSLLYCRLAMVLVGSTVVASRVIGQDMEPFLATALRHAMALPLFLALMRATGARMPRPGRRDTLLLLVQAAAGSVGYTVLLILGVAASSAADAGVIAGTLPAVSALFAVLALGERPSIRLATAIALATAGVLAVSLAGGDGAPAAAHWRGHALVLAAVACEAVFILANKRLREPVAPLALSTLMSAGGLLLSLPAAWLAARGGPAHAWSAPALWGVAYYALLPTVAGFLLWYAGSQRVSGAAASLTTALLPVSALLLSAVVLGEAIRPGQWLGLGCVMLAVALSAGASPRPRTPAMPASPPSPSRP